MNNIEMLSKKETKWRKYFLIFLSFWLSTICNGQYLKQYDWVNSFGGLDVDVGKSVCTDDFGNIYITGFFQSEAVFGDEHLVSNGDTDIFVAKFDTDGNLLWVKQFGSGIRKNLIATEMGTAIKCDKKGNIYLAGIFSWSVIFGDTTLVSKGGDDIFLVKMSTAGKIIRANRYGTIGHDFVHDFEIEIDGTLLISASFGSKPEQETFRNSRNSSYAILARIDKMGEMSILNHALSPGSLQGSQVIADKNNNIYWGLNYTNVIEVEEQRIYSNGKSDIVLVKLDKSGNAIWYKKIGGRFDDKMNDLALYKGNELLLTGSFEDKIAFADREILSNGKSDMLLCQIDVFGNVNWLEKIGGKLNESGISVSSDADDNIVIAGIFQDEIVTNVDTLKAKGYFDIVIACFNPYHHYLKSHHIGGAYGDFVESLSISQGYVNFTGHFRNTMALNNLEIASIGKEDGFLGRFPLFLNGELHTKIDNFDGVHGAVVLINPNPSTGIFTISSPQSNLKDINIKILNMSGYQVDWFYCDKFPFVLDLSHLPQGVYMAHIQIQNQTFFEKLIISSK